MHVSRNDESSNRSGSKSSFLEKFLYVDTELFIPKLRYSSTQLLMGWVPTAGVRTKMSRSAGELTIAGTCEAEEWSFSGSRLHHLIPGKTYDFSGWMRVDALETETTFFKFELRKDGAWFRNLNTPEYDMSRMGEWQRLAVQFTAADGETASVKIHVEKRPFGAAAGASIAVKDLELSAAEEATVSEGAPASAAGDGLPFVSVIVPVFNAESTLSLCLASLTRLSYPSDRYEVIVVDNGSTDRTLEIARTFPVTILCEHERRGSYAARNKGIAAARGEILAFTDSDCIADREWLSLLLAQHRDETIGCFAGGISTYAPSTLTEVFSEREGILRQTHALKHPFLPFAQTANAAYRRSVVGEIGPFVPELTSGGDAEIAWRMQKRLGLRIHFEPRAVIFHKHRTSLSELGKQFRKYQHGRTALKQLYPDLQIETVEATRKRLQALLGKAKGGLRHSLSLYLRREIDAVELASPFLWSFITYCELSESRKLERGEVPSPQLSPYAPDWKPDPERKVLLLIAPRLPEFDRASGDLRLYRLLQMLSEEFSVIFFNDQLWERFLPAGEKRYLTALLDLGIKVVNSETQLAPLLKGIRVDVVLCEFYHLWLKHRPLVTQHSPSAVTIVDSVDVHFLREALMGETLDDAAMRETAQKTKKNELMAYHLADYVWAVSEPDRKGLLAAGLPEEKLHIVPNIHVIEEQVPGLDAREPNTLLFVGGFQHQPNVDGVLFFIREVLPLVAAEIPEVKVTIVGDSPPKEVVDAATSCAGRVNVVGYVPETEPYLNGAAISIAPLRYGAGLKGKVGEALSYGLPLVSTSIGTQGMNLRSGEDCFIADTPVDFASGIVKLLRSADLWARFSENGRRFMLETFGYEQVKRDTLRFLTSLENAERSRKHPRASVVYLTKNGGELFKKSLEGVLSQRVNFDYEVVVVDSGSTDGTLEYLAEQPVKLHSINPEEFNFGLTRDLGFQLASGDVVIAISQDAVPDGKEWLASLVLPFNDPEIAVVQCKDILPTNERIFYWHNVGLLYYTKDCTKWQDEYKIGLSFTCCAIRRSVWKTCQIGRAEMSEDKLFQKKLVENGHKIIRSEKARDFHHHDYDIVSLAKRCQNEGMGWKNVGIDYTVTDMISDIFNKDVLMFLAAGIARGRIRKKAELLFPIIRPLFVFLGNRHTSRYVK